MITASRIAALVPLALLFACDTQTDQPIVGLQAQAFAHSEWSEPVNLGSVVNSAAGDNDPALAGDGLSLYFASDRPGGLGGIDIWVAKRASPESPWEAPANLGAPINTIDNDGTPALSADGHRLFFNSNRPGGQGGNDIWMARRASPANDIGWEAPVDLGPDVNTAADELGPAYVPSDGGGALYFTRGTPLPFDLYRAEVGRDGRTRGPALPVAELNDPNALDSQPTVRADGQEILFVSSRPGGSGGNDIWVSTRRSVQDPWSPPENWGGPPLNTSSGDLQPDLSHDGRTLLFSSNRGGSGRADLWMSTRTPSGH
jgi:Tol biopolymer transport system component